MTDFRKTLNEVLAVDPDAPAIEYKKTWHSWGEIKRTIDGIDAALSAAGLGSGTAVGILLRNHPPSVAAMLSVVFGDRCQVTLNPMMPPEKLYADMRATKVPAIVAEAEDWARPGFEDVARDLGALGIELTGDAERPVRLRPGLDTVGPGLHHPPAPGMAMEMLTSGTTGAPKRIPLEYKGVEISLVDAMVYERDRKPDEPGRLRGGLIICHVSLVHTGGFWTVMTALLAGRKLCLLEKFNVPEWLDAVARHKPKVAAVPPAGLRMLLDAHPTKEQLGSLVALRAGTAPLDPDITDAFLARYDIPVLNNYGATEFGGVAGWTLDDFRKSWKEKRGSVGRLQQNVEGRVVDPGDFHVLKPGEEGLLEMRGPQFGNNLQWVRTTDRAVVDADRFLWITGRADNAIIRGGFKVHPDDVVKALEQHPAVREACVIAMPDRRLGEVPVAALVLKSGAPAPSAEDLSQFLRRSLTAYQIPVAFKILDEFPRTPSMKVSQPLLKELFAAEFPA